MSTGIAGGCLFNNENRREFSSYMEQEIRSGFLAKEQQNYLLSPAQAGSFFSGSAGLVSTPSVLSLTKMIFSV